MAKANDTFRIETEQGDILTIKKWRTYETYFCGWKFFHIRNCKRAIYHDNFGGSWVYIKDHDMWYRAVSSATCAYLRFVYETHPEWAHKNSLTATTYHK